ncbi:hypothetical protein HY251_11875 [bacterium]|nr:hypothetical protein [bacterium]
MADSTEDLLARAIPKLASASEEKARKVRGKLGRFAARAWAKGPERLLALGLSVPERAHASARRFAREAGDDPEGRFLDVARKALSDDEAFVAFARALAKAYARALAKKMSQETEAVVTNDGAEAEEENEEPEEKAPRVQVEEIEPDAPEEEPERKNAKPPADEAPALAVPESSDELPVLKKKAEPPPAKKKERGEFNRVSLDDEGETLEEVAKAATPVVAPREAAPPEPRGALRPGSGQADAEAARSIERYKKTGDPLDLGNARKAFKAALDGARIPQARAAARAGLALTHLLNGQDEEARKLAEKATEEDPSCALAASVASRASHGEGARERLKAGLLRARIALKADAKKAAREAKLLQEAFPDEPAPLLVALVAASHAGDEIFAHVKAAWAKYPSPRFADLALGDGLDLPAAKAIAAWGASELAAGPEALMKTQKDLDSKENVLAGAFQLALGVARTALATRGDVSKRDEQELRGAIGESLLGLQYYDAAAAAFEKGQSIDRAGDLANDLGKGAERARELRRAFDKPGIKARSGSLDGAGTVALKKAIAARAARAMTERQTESEAVSKAEHETAVALAANAALRASVERRAKSGEKENPLAPLIDIEQQLRELESSKEALSGKKSEEKKGFFSRALDKVKDTAKGAELAVRIKLIESKRDDALRAVAKNLRDAPPGGWGDAALDALSARGRALEARLEHLDDELAQARKITSKLPEL